MFCNQCGHEIPEGMTSCVNCGKPVMPNGGMTQPVMPNGGMTQPVMPNGGMTPPVMPNGGMTPQVQPAGGNGKNKKVLFGILAAAIVLLVLCIGSLIYYFNRPIYKIEMAVKKDNIEKVVAFYPRLTKDEQQDYVQDQMYDYAVNLMEQYQNETLSYEDADDKLTMLSNGFMEDYPGFQELAGQLAMLEESRKAFEKAQEAFEKNDYQLAAEQYALVIEEDRNYEAAQEQLKNLIPDITGTWKTQMDLGPVLAQELGVDEDDVEFKVDVVYEFRSDNTANCYCDEESVYANKESFRNFLIDYYYNYFEEMMGMNREQIDAYYYIYSNQTIEEMIDDNIDLDALFESMTEGMDSKDFEYETQIDCFAIKQEDGSEVHMYFEMPDADTLVLTGTDSTGYTDGTQDILSSVGMDFPTTFTRK